MFISSRKLSPLQSLTSFRALLRLVGLSGSLDRRSVQPIGFEVSNAGQGADGGDSQVAALTYVSSQILTRLPSIVRISALLSLGCFIAGACTGVHAALGILRSPHGASDVLMLVGSVLAICLSRWLWIGVVDPAVMSQLWELAREHDRARVWGAFLRAQDQGLRVGDTITWTTRDYGTFWLIRSFCTTCLTPNGRAENRR